MIRAQVLFDTMNSSRSPHAESTMASVNVQRLTQQPVVSAVVLLALTLFIRFMRKLVSQRRRFQKLQAQGLPMPPHSFLFGHIPVLIKITSSLPPDAHACYLSVFVRKAYPELTSDFYLDLWPLAPEMLVVGSPELLHQVTQKYVMNKNFILRNFLFPLTDGLDMVSTNGAYWKKWRAIFNPGFSASHLLKLAPAIVKEVQVCCEILDEHVASKDIFPMKPLTDNLILDVIGKVVLDVHLNCQKTFSPVVHSLRTQIMWMATGVDFNLFRRYNPVRPLKQWYHKRVVNEYVNRELDRRIEEFQTSKPDLKNNRTVTDLALNAYAESQDNDLTTLRDPDFKKICASQIKIFLFAGHDTTSSGACFTLFLLSQNPDVLARMRDEHTSLFGPDPSKAAALISETPHLLNQLNYTTAVIKESMRILSPVTSSREGDADISLIDTLGRAFSTRKDTVVWINQVGAHRDPLYWPEPESFLPHRWLVEADDPLHPVKGLWRPFEQGSRNCLGQELAMIEMKIVLVLMSRTYTFKPAYRELDAKEGRKQTTVLGVEAYQTDSMQPRGSLPVMVERIHS